MDANANTYGPKKPEEKCEDLELKVSYHRRRTSFCLAPYERVVPARSIRSKSGMTAWLRIPVLKRKHGANGKVLC